MGTAETIFEKVRALPAEKQQSALDFVSFLEQQVKATPKPEVSLFYYGMCADLGGPVPSIEDIAEMRAEAWANWPDEDI